METGEPLLHANETTLVSYGLAMKRVVFQDDAMLYHTVRSAVYSRHARQLILSGVFQ